MSPDRDDARGARVSRIGPLVIVTSVVVLACGILYYPIAMERFMAKYSGVSYTVMPAFEVQVFARKYDWHFHYAGPDAVFGATSPSRVTKDNPIGLDGSDPNAQDDFVAGELVLPCGPAIRLRSHSADVIHTLGNLQGSFELDCIPGVPGDSILQTPAASTSGTLQCTTLCGAKHKHHHAPFRFVSDSDYESWFNAQLIAAQTSKPPPAASQTR